MEKIILIGTGGFAKEVVFTLLRSKKFEVIGVVDDGYTDANQTFFDYQVIGKVSHLETVAERTGVVLAIANPEVKERIISRVSKNRNLYFPNIIDETALFGLNVRLGKGNIVMANTTFTADISVGDFNMINIGSTIGHDSVIGSFSSIYPSVNLSGNASVGSKTELGAGSKVIQSISIGDESVIGAGSVVIRNVESRQKVVGVPARVIESW